MPQFDETTAARLQQIADADAKDLTGEGAVFEGDWKWAKERGVVSEHSQPTDLMSKQEFAAFVRRYDRTQPAAEPLGPFDAQIIPRFPGAQTPEG